ncbi:MAG: hypothetical protein V4671_00210, partial [Armatimonadota bacterium]
MSPTTEGDGKWSSSVRLLFYVGMSPCVLGTHLRFLYRGLQKLQLGSAMFYFRISRYALPIVLGMINVSAVAAVPQSQTINVNPRAISSQNFIAAIDQIEAWTNSTKYSNQGWIYLLELASKLQALASEDPEYLASLFRTCQEHWVPSQRWEILVEPFRRGSFKPDGLGQTQLVFLSEAYQSYVKNRMPKGDNAGNNSRLNLRSTNSPSFERAAKVFLLLRAMFALPEGEAKNTDQRATWAGHQRFRTAHRFYAKKGNYAWPLSWNNQHPQIIAPLFFYKGSSYDCVLEYRFFMKNFRLRDLKTGKERGELPLLQSLQSSADLDEVITLCGGPTTVVLNGAGVIIESRSKTSRFSTTPLGDIYQSSGYMSASEKDVTSLRALLEKGVDVNVRSTEDRTP